MILRTFTLCGFVGMLALSASAQSSFVNWEDSQVHPLDLTPDHTRLLAVNTADNRLEVFDVSGGSPISIGAIPVGLDPVSVRARTNTEAWVVNVISDSVSIVDLTSMNVIASIHTGDEPCDVVFAGSPQRAFVSCSQASQVEVYDPANPGAAPTIVAIDAETPRAMAVDAAGANVFVGIFESGNASTAAGGGADTSMSGGRVIGFPPNVVSDAAGPYGGVNPPPNSGTSFSPPINPALPAPPNVSLIVKKNAAGQWMDDNSHDWTDLISGPNAALSGRLPGWDLPDHDLAIIDASTLGVQYVNGCMNICMALAVNPANGRVTIVGTDAINEIRFEPIVNGKFVRVEMATADPVIPARLDVKDLNAHLDYSTSSIPQAERNKSIGDPRGIVWNSAGTRGYVTGMGSNNLIVIDAAGARVGITPTIEVGEGPTGIVLDEGTSRLYVLNKFEGSISAVDPSTELEVSRVPFFDPSPAAIKAGRKHLYDTHKNSGLGQVACGSCHIDGRMDRLAWDLGDPSGSMKSTTGQNKGFGFPFLGGGFQDFHPMKGPMTTQTLQDIIGKEPLHWRGDRNGIEEFNGAFIGLQGDDTNLSPVEMQEYENFLATIYFPPNPSRNFDNTLPTSLPLAGHYTTGRFSPAGQPLPNGNAQRGSTIYRTGLLDAGAIDCVTCHTMPTGMGTDMRWNGSKYLPLAVGPNGEHHHGLVSVDGVSNVTMKIPQLRNGYKKRGFNTTILSNVAGFGYLHDGSVDSLERFVSEPVFTINNDQDSADLTALLLSFAGSDLPSGNVFSLRNPPGTASQDTHAAVGRQVTITDGTSPTPEQTALITQILGFADINKVGVVVKGRQAGIQRGYTYGGGHFQSDRAAQTLTPDQLLMSAAAGSELTYTVVPKGTETRIGIDRDEDGFYDRDEIDMGSDPADPQSTPQLTCRTGNINGGAGAPVNVIFVNGSAGSDPDRVINVTTTTPFTLTIQAAPSGGSRYAMYAWLGAPSASSVRLLPQGLGTTCMPTPLSAGGPKPRKRANNIGFTAQLGTENWPGPPTRPAPYTLLSLPAGIGKPVTFFLQGLMLDSNAPNGQAGVTNGIVVISQ